MFCIKKEKSIKQMNFSYFGKMDVIVDVITGLLLMISLILSRLVVYNNPHKKYTKEIYEKCGKLNFVLNRSFFLFFICVFCDRNNERYDNNLPDIIFIFSKILKSWLFL